MHYAGWYLGQMFSAKDSRHIDGMDEKLNEHINFAMEQLHQSPMELSENMVKHQLKLPDRQCRIAEMSQRVQDAIVMLVTALWAHNENDKVMIRAADVLCQDLTRKLTGERPSDSYFKDCSKLADMIIAGEFKAIQEIEQADIIFSYDKAPAKKEAVKAGA